VEDAPVLAVLGADVAEPFRPGHVLDHHLELGVRGHAEVGEVRVGGLHPAHHLRLGGRRRPLIGGEALHHHRHRALPGLGGELAPAHHLAPGDGPGGVDLRRAHAVPPPSGSGTETVATAAFDAAAPMS